ncbi:probable mitochondrial intermediate peptidase mitochondrial [Phtheirospermum japonicum]|uniref:Probable mitochondrial intermediate peptidase mitochondrial n=1 Tax=Phtheirospermum japonicum TaxID=374723 RepID=A0A830BTM7_9LAMI|nr:probable mitochondrial intermediate peptidase mitochondrial [Phtheirospermum japonicum]
MFMPTHYAEVMSNIGCVVNVFETLPLFFHEFSRMLHKHFPYSTYAHYLNMLRALIRTPAEYSSYARRFIHSAAAPLVRETGLYGFDQLKTPKGFQRMVDDAIERSNELVNCIAEMPSPPEIIKAMDEISDTVCTVIDSAELCRHTHPDREFVEEASKASLRLNEYLHFLNSNPSLYHAVVKAEQNRHMLTEEAARAARHLRIDLEKGGIHLSPEKLDRVNQLNMDIIQLCREFNENIITDPGHVDIYPASRIPKKLHHLTKPIYRPSSFASKKSTGLDSNSKERGLRVLTEPNTLCSILQLAPDAEVRKLAYIRGNSSPPANLVVLDKLLSARHEFSEIMGFKSYAELTLKENMASSPEVVLSFLHDMSKMVRPKAEEEFKKILDFKRARGGQSVTDLEPWDEPYFTRLMKASAHNLDYSVVSSYFSLPQCIEGLKVLAGSLFGVKFHEIPLGPGESWHPDVLKLSLYHPDEGDLGCFYLDLKSRKDKHPICAHFAIKGGRRISDTEYQLPIVALVCNFSRSSRTSQSVLLHHSDVETLFHEFGHALHSLLSRTDYQHFSGTRVALDFAETPSNLFESDRPTCSVIPMVLKFPFCLQLGSDAMVSDLRFCLMTVEDAGESDLGLTFGSVVAALTAGGGLGLKMSAAFGEGRCCNVLVKGLTHRPSLQFGVCLSSSAVSTVVVDGNHVSHYCGVLVSVVYYAWDYRFLRTFAKHYSTGDLIPENLVKSLVGAKNMFAATELQRQVFYALIDQTLHASQPSSVKDTISIVADLKREHTSWKHVEGTHWHTRFTHLVTYGAGIYLYAKCFAATIWKKIIQEDPLSLSAGSAVRSKFLQPGGAKDATVILNDLVGDCVIRNQKGGIIPDITSLGEEMKLFK